MRLRFLHTVPSDNPHFPFQPGQILEMPRLTSEMRHWLREGWASLLPEPAEAAVLDDPPEMATVSRPKGRGSRA